jgi:hypothetical protein
MELLLILQKQVMALWTKAMQSQSNSEREQLLKQYRETYNKYVRHKRWLQLLGS